MDSVTHALTAASIFLALGRPELVPFAALGSVAMDADILLIRLPERNPSRYVLTHGGITHSIAGALLTGGIFYALTAAVTLAGPGASIFDGSLGFWALAALLTGSLTHVFSDFLAYPGIPLLYPFTDRKFTAGIFAGPSLVLLVASWAYLGTLLVSLTTLADYRVWAWIFVGYLAAKVLLKASVALTTEGTTIPTKNPVHWIVIRDDGASYSILFRDLLRGLSEPRTFPKRVNVSSAELEELRDMPEVRKLRYDSYITTAERKDGTIILRDPFRAEGFTRYPFGNATVVVPAKEAKTG